MSDLKKGDTYCTMWTTHLEGPFIYDGEANLLFNAMIVADSNTLIPAQFGFDMMRDHYTNKNGELYVEMADLVTTKAIDEVIASLETKIHKLKCLQELSPQLTKALGAGK